MSVHLIHECWHCGHDCWCPHGDVSPRDCTHQCAEREPTRVPDEFDDDEEHDIPEDELIT